MNKILAVVVLLAASFPAWAATYYVDSARTDNSGVGNSWGSAKKTIAAGVALLSSGDTLKIKTGTYAEAVNIATRFNTPTRIETDDGAGNPGIVTITGVGSCQTAQTVVCTNNSGKLIWDGRQSVTEGAGSYGFILNPSSAAIGIYVHEYTANDAVKVLRTEILGTKQAADHGSITVRYAGSAEVGYNKINQTGGNVGDCIIVESQGPAPPLTTSGSIHHNDVKCNPSNGYGAITQKRTNNVNVYNNYIHDIGNGGVGIILRDQTLIGPDGSEVYYNTIVNNTNMRTGIQIRGYTAGAGGGTDNALIYNNRIVATNAFSEGVFMVNDPSDYNKIYNNLIVGGSTYFVTSFGDNEGRNNEIFNNYATGNIGGWFETTNLQNMFSVTGTNYENIPEGSVPSNVGLPSGATYTVTPSAGTGGTISPNTAQTVNSGSTIAFTVTPNSGYTASVGGTCGGSLVGTTYTTAAVTANCTVSATFADTQVPTTPADVDASSPSTTSVSLNWTASTDNAAVTEYRIEACAGWNCSSWAQIGTSATTSFTHGGLTPATNPTIYRYRIRAADAANNLSSYSTAIYFNARPTIPAFPGAEGAGATSKGGRGGTVYRVTSLSGGTEAGTLRACAVIATEPRTCVFDVAGNIELTSHINVSSPYLTIAGHTAPGGGITISGKNSPNVSLTVRTHNVTIRGLRFRKGYNAATASQDGDSTNVTSVSTTSGPVGPVIFDHVTASWGQDENGETWGMTPRAPKDITYMRSMIYEPLLSHPVNFLTGAFDNATAEKMTNIDIHHSILANSSHRNPMAKNKSFRFVNNLVYNWADWAYAQLGTVQADVIGNKFKTGPLYMTESSKAYEIQVDPVGGTTTPNVGTASLYVAGNVGPHNADPLADNWPMTRRIDIETNAMAELGPLDEGTYRRLSLLPALPFPITVSSITTEEANVLALAGASRRLDCAGNWVGMRDSADARIVTEYGTNAGIVPANEDAVGGYPTLAAGTACTDTDSDGMPDTWETANGLNPASATDGTAVHVSGYTNLEWYLAGDADITPPVLSGLSPSGDQPAPVTSIALALTTSENATCRYDLNGVSDYDFMSNYTTTGGTSHSATVTVRKGGVYMPAAKCRDAANNTSASPAWRFAVPDEPKRRGSR